MAEHSTADFNVIQWISMALNVLFGGVIMKLVPHFTRMSADVDRHNKEIPALQAQHTESIKLLHDIHTSVQVIKATMPKRKHDVESEGNEHA